MRQRGTAANMCGNAARKNATLAEQRRALDQQGLAEAYLIGRGC
jgi:diaminopimelate epimerase